jgi:hypothetical protein
MIKRYNQFVKEELEFGAPGQAPSPSRETETPVRPDTDRPTRERPSRPGSIPDDVPSEQDNPLARGAALEFEDDLDLENDLDLESDLDLDNEMDMDFNDDEFEEEQEDIYSTKLKELATALGLETSAVQSNRLEFEGKEIIFPSETEKFHVDRKKFDTVDQVVNYLQGTTDRVTPRLEDDSIDPEFEAKSYRFSRGEKLIK